jgi:hypothetical protein
MLHPKESEMPRNIFVYSILIFLFVAGCGLFSIPMPKSSPTSLPAPLETATAEPSALPVLNDEWTINMKHTGGIMGLSRSIEILSDGNFTVVDERANKTIMGTLPADALSKVKEQVASSKYIPASGPSGMVCADCFVYDLEIYGNGGNFTIQLDDISLPDSGLEPLVRYLREIIETTLK